jgi:hypothetical protein
LAWAQTRAIAAAATASPGLRPSVDHLRRLAEIIREVDGGNRLGAAALAKAILAHPGFSGPVPVRKGAPFIQPPWS